MKGLFSKTFGVIPELRSGDRSIEPRKLHFFWGIAGISEKMESLVFRAKKTLVHSQSRDRHFDF